MTTTTTVMQLSRGAKRIWDIFQNAVIEQYTNRGKLPVVFRVRYYAPADLADFFKAIDQKWETRYGNDYTIKATPRR